jgi:hypothetical protein
LPTLFGVFSILGSIDTIGIRQPELQRRSVVEEMRWSRTLVRSYLWAGSAPLSVIWRMAPISLGFNLIRSRQRR